MIPRGFEALGLEAAWTTRGRSGMLAQQIERDMAQDGDILSGIARAHPRRVLVKGDIEDPMDLILNPPMTAHRGPKHFRAHHAAEQVIANLVRWARERRVRVEGTSLDMNPAQRL